MDVNLPTYLNYLDTHIVTTASYIDSLLDIHPPEKICYSIYINHLVHPKLFLTTAMHMSWIFCPTSFSAVFHNAAVRTGTVV